MIQTTFCHCVIQFFSDMTNCQVITLVFVLAHFLQIYGKINTKKN